MSLMKGHLFCCFSTIKSTIWTNLFISSRSSHCWWVGEKEKKEKREQQDQHLGPPLISVLSTDSCANIMHKVGSVLVWQCKLALLMGRVGAGIKNTLTRASPLTNLLHQLACVFMWFCSCYFLYKQNNWKPANYCWYYLCWVWYS